MKKIVRGTLLGLLIALVIMQFIQPDKTNPESDPSQDFITMNSIDGEIGHLLKTACYDCHSNNTTWPWYSSVAPFSYVVAHHVEEGREHLNFSVWGTYSAERANHKLEECVEEIVEGEMPMAGYVALHSEADLTEEQLEMLMAKFAELQQ
ncbi:heme-binding domain-containing protein [Phaeocystidibacter luteus]|uniref:Cytochrome C n=1 Tax=Phaeocystidibacter luteus TaxID=911197 RepID=A0A6N6RJH0_9FLAO|nr:heme-binding domain-containing protein [Phaeocystidibacter luteus]KAB2807321.1 cytochrome C [Phaeocystidibacter luteus]